MLTAKIWNDYWEKYNKQTSHLILFGKCAQFLRHHTAAFQVDLDRQVKKCPSPITPPSPLPKLRPPPSPLPRLRPSLPSLWPSPSWSSCSSPPCHLNTGWFDSGLLINADKHWWVQITKPCPANLDMLMMKLECISKEGLTQLRQCFVFSYFHINCPPTLEYESSRLVCNQVAFLPTYNALWRFIYQEAVTGTWWWLTLWST